MCWMKESLVEFITGRMSELRSSWREVFKQPGQKHQGGFTSCLLSLVTPCWFLVGSVYTSKLSQNTPLRVIPVTIYLFNKYLSIAYYVPDTFVDTGNTVVNKTDQEPLVLMERTFYWSRVTEDYKSQQESDIWSKT